jgi:hypothetical protein
VGTILQQKLEAAALLIFNMQTANWFNEKLQEAQARTEPLCSAIVTEIDDLMVKSGQYEIRVWGTRSASKLHAIVVHRSRHRSKKLLKGIVN